MTGADGTVLALRRREDGSGFAIADVPLTRSVPQPVPDRFWLQRRGVVAAAAWAYQNPYGRAQYRRSHAQQPLTAPTHAGVVQPASGVLR